MKIRLFFALVFSFHCVLLATKDNFFEEGLKDSDGLIAAEGNFPAVFQDLGKLLKGSGKYLFLRIPSVGTLTIDASIDASLRQVPSVRKWLKELEKSNPTNSAIVRDASKLVNTPIKMLLGVPVDQSGRLYDRGDMSTQASKVISKSIGFVILDMTGMTDNPVALFAVNTGGDIISQTFYEAAGSWRQLDVNTRIGYFLYVGLNLGKHFGDSLRSVPVKAATGYIIGAAINYFEVDFLVGNLTVGAIDSVKYYTPECIKDEVVSATNLLIESVNQTSPALASEMVMIDPELWLISFTRSFARSLALTTGCKVSMDITRSLQRTRAKPYVNPAIMLMTAVVLGYQVGDRAISAIQSAVGSAPDSRSNSDL